MKGWRRCVGLALALGLAGSIARAAHAKAAPAEVVAAETAPAGALDELRALRAEITQLRERPEPATAADIERLRTEVERLVTVDRDLARRLDARPPAAPDPAGDGVGGIPWTGIAAGMLAGWGLSRLANRRRERHQRGRLRV